MKSTLRGNIWDDKLKANSQKNLIRTKITISTTLVGYLRLFIAKFR